MRPNWRSSGVATEDAIVSGLAPGNAAWTWMVGNSTCGNGDTGSSRNAMAPASASAPVSSVVATGFLMKTSEMLMTLEPEWFPQRHPLRAIWQIAPPCGRRSGKSPRRVEREHLADEQAADDRNTQRAAQLGADPRS